MTLNEPMLSEDLLYMDVGIYSYIEIFIYIHIHTETECTIPIPLTKFSTGLRPVLIALVSLLVKCKVPFW